MKVSDIFKEILLEQSELKELFGVSFDARAWMPIIKSQLKLAKQYYKKNLPIPDMTINGRDYMAQYNVFPIDVIHMYINPRYGNGAGYDEQKSGYEKDKQYHVYLHFGPEAGDSAINHELRYAYEDFMRLSRGSVPMRSTKEGALLFGGDFEKFFMNGRRYEPYHTLIMGLYLTSKIERSGFSESVYDNDLPATDLIKTVMSHAEPEYLRTFHPDKLKSNWDEIKKNFKVPVFDKFNDYQSFMNWASDEIRYKGEKSLKKLQKVQYHREQNKKKGAA